jgi:hypothetical protein
MTINEISIIGKVSVESAIGALPMQGTARGAVKSQDATIMTRVENAIELALVTSMHLWQRWSACSSAASATMSACVSVRNSNLVPVNTGSTCHPRNVGFFDR